MIDRFNYIVVTFFYIGRMPFLQGTLASFFSCLVIYFFFIFLVPSFYLQISVLIMLLFIAFLSIKRYQLKSNHYDPPEIVIDEVCGMMISILFFNYLNDLANSFSSEHIRYLITAFITFRILDGVKPSFIYRIQLRNSVSSILLDDVLCGLLTLLIVSTLKLSSII
ncbi:MAG: hypothetical protein CMG00_01780 [Candidatus Marinimicrobia bacterium]|nr:hypothetical protein [Candidatus Neomarinimicrobiota bacterium]